MFVFASVTVFVFVEGGDLNEKCRRQHLAVTGPPPTHNRAPAQKLTSTQLFCPSTVGNNNILQIRITSLAAKQPFYYMFLHPHIFQC